MDAWEPQDLWTLETLEPQDLGKLPLQFSFEIQNLNTVPLFLLYKNTTIKFLIGMVQLFFSKEQLFRKTYPSGCI